MTPLLGFLPDLRETFPYIYQFMKEHRWTAWWRKVLSSQEGSCVQEALLAWSLGTSPSLCGCVCPLEVLQTPQRLHYIGMIKHLTPFSDVLPSQGGGGVCWKFQASNHGLVFLVTSPHPRTIQEPTQGCPVRKKHSYHTGNYKFQEPCVRNRDQEPILEQETFLVFLSLWKLEEFKELYTRDQGPEINIYFLLPHSLSQEELKSQNSTQNSTSSPLQS